MYSVIECLTQDHHHGLVAFAALICIVGSCLSVMNSRRLLSATRARVRTQLFLSGLIAGATIWSTHFIAMLAYDPGYEHGYEPVLTGISLGVGVLGTTAANAFLVYSPRRLKFLLGGSVFGLTVSLMHYIGMGAYQLPGKIIWDTQMTLASVILSVGLGAAAFHRIVFPVTRYCWAGGAVLMVLAICAMHFTGMAAISLKLSPLVVVAPQVMPDETLGLSVFAVATLVFVVGFAALSNETNLEREAFERLEHSATHDPLTGLPNRLMLSRQMAGCAQMIKQDETWRVAVLTIDLNLFKEVNDLFGHSFGDSVLAEISHRLHDSGATN